MKLLKNKKYLLGLGIIISAAVISFAVLSLNKPAGNNSVPKEKPVTVSDIKNFVSKTPLPKKDLTVKRTTQSVNGYKITSAKSGNIDSPVSFEIGGGNISFTSIGEPNLGTMNPSSVTSDDDGKITYENVYNGINLIYTPTEQGILEEYEVRAKRQIKYLVQKIDITNLTYKKQDDGSIMFSNASGGFAFAVPRPVMYEKYNTRERNFDLHYEIFEVNGQTFLAKVIDEEGRRWLNSRANYPVMIDATILLTLFSYTSYPTVDNAWQIGVQTVGSGDLVIKPGEGTTWSLASEIDNTKDLNSLAVACDGNNVSHQMTPDGNALFPNFSCDGNIVVTTKVKDINKLNSLDFIYSGFTTTVNSLVDTGKPIIISSSVNPPVVKVGDIITVTAEVADTKGIASVSADIGGVETITLNLKDGTSANGTWTGSWKVHSTATKPYEVLITALNAEGDSSQSSIGFFDPYTCLGGGDHGGADWNPVSDGCASNEIAGEHTNIGIFSINNGQTATVKAFDQINQYGIATISASTATIAGTLTAQGKGWAGGSTSGGTGAGPSGGLGHSSYKVNAGGGAHGGTGGAGSGQGGGVAGGSTIYGSLVDAGDFGSGGGGQGNSGFAGGAGGGSIRITTTGDLTVFGTISSNGSSGSTGCGGTSGAGSGGGIYLYSNNISGNGSITANGGDGLSGGCNIPNKGGNGGGGRIAIYYTDTNSYTGSINTSAGANGNGGIYGTSFVKNFTTGDLLIPSNNNIWYGTDLSSWTFHDLIINGNITFQATSSTLLTITATGSSTFASGVTITAGGSYTTNSNGVGVYFNLTGDVTIPSATTITATGKGYAGGSTSGGTGAGSSGGLGHSSYKVNAGGGAHGGTGGAGSGQGGGVAGGSTIYGSLTIPLDLGSGGGGQGNSGFAGGAGGGSIRITTTGDLTVFGTISSNGSSGSTGCGGTSGAGAGGSIYLIMKELQGSGSIIANGGSGLAGGCNQPNLGGDGGGGRIALYCTDGGNWLGNNLASSSATAAGSGGNGGANGTVYTSNCYVINPKVGGNTRFNGNVRIR